MILAALIECIADGLPNRHADVIPLRRDDQFLFGLKRLTARSVLDLTRDGSAQLHRTCRG